MRDEDGENCDELCVYLVTVHTYAQAAPLHAVTLLSINASKWIATP